MCIYIYIYVYNTWIFQLFMFMPFPKKAQIYGGLMEKHLFH